MRHSTVSFICLCGTIISIVTALPLPESNQELDVLQIPLNNEKELDVLTLGTADQLADRNKRTIGILRELFPELTKESGDGAAINLSALNKQLEETIRVARQASENADADQNLTKTNEVQGSNSNSDSSSSDNQKTPNTKPPAIDDLNLDSNEDINMDDRNKRFLSFSASGGDGKSTGGNSGNFLFDIVRLFSGSVQTQANDEAANAPSNGDSAGEEDTTESDNSSRNDGYTEGIPGPVTRLVVLANRGLANLIQDLILRIAATSERLVNFKARLITALI